MKAKIIPELSESQRVCLGLLLEGPLRLDELISKISITATVESLKDDLIKLIQNGYVNKRKFEDLYIITKEGKNFLVEIKE